MKPVAVIILNWNGRKLLERYLPTVIENTSAELADVIVADNGSSDGSVEFLKQNFPDVKLLSWDENLGFAGGYNRAIELSRYEYTVLLNSDVETKSDWLTPLFQFISSRPDIGAVQPKIKSLRSPEMFEYAGAAGGYLDCNGYPYCRGRLFDVVEEDQHQYDTSVQVMWASGACLMVRTDAYLEVGGLDTSFFAHMEEIDLCWRMQLAGYKVMATGESEVYHLGGASLDASHPRKTYLNFRNSLYLLYKNLPKGWGRWAILFRRRMLDTIAWAKFVATGKWGHASAVVKAHIHYLTGRKNLTMPQSPVKENLLKNSPEGRRNILVDYYLKRRHKFSDL